MPLLGEPGHKSMTEFLQRVTIEMGLEKPKSICVISAHWEEESVKVSTGSKQLLYDYYGFPPEAYAPHLKYGAKGAKESAKRAKELLEEASVGPLVRSQNKEVTIVERGFDHGVFVLLKLMYPAADIPVFQVSLLESLDPKAHVEIGKALAKLRDEGVLIIGSGSSMHNMSVLMKGDPTARDRGEAFHEWLKQTCGDEKCADLLGEWESAPFARYCHPREEHLIPLMVCAGAANNDKGRMIWEDRVLGMDFRMGSVAFESQS